MLTKEWWTPIKLWNNGIIHSASAFSTARVWWNVESGENNRDVDEWRSKGGIAVNSLFNLSCAT